MTFAEYMAEHGIAEETIKKFDLSEGKSEKYGSQLIIPIKDAKGITIFNKYRNLDFTKDGNIPKFFYDPGYNAELYNAQIIADSEYVFILEGEPDVWKATEDNIPAVCGTSGAKTFKAEWAKMLEDKRIFILFDNDQTGKEGMEKLREFFPMAFCIELPEGFKDYCEYRLKHSIEEFQKLVEKEKEKQTATYEDICTTIDKWLLLPDKNVLKIIFASLISHYFTSDPLWIFLVAPPSGTKTELITLLSALPIVYMISSMTEKTLFSGLEGHRKESPSLMMRIPNAIITMKDFTSILSMRQEEKLSILGQLREIYDGRYDRAFGTGTEIHWTGRVTLIAGVTSIIDNQHTLFQTMGERFVMYRILQPNDEKVAEKALSMSGQEAEMRQELKIIMHKFFAGIKIPKIEEISISKEIVKAVAALASFVVIARSGIIRNSYGNKEIELIPEPEAPSRLTKQLGVLLRALAVLADRKEVTWEDYYLMLRVALDTIPRNKLIHLIFLVDREDGAKTSDVANHTGYSISGAEIILEDLVALKLLIKSEYGQGFTPNWIVSEKCLGYLKKILPYNNDSLYKYFKEDDPYFPFIKKCLGEPKEENFVENLKKKESSSDI